MRIGINLLYLIPGVVGGTETYAWGLIDGLKSTDSDHEFVVFLNRESAELGSAMPTKFTPVVCPISAVNRKERYYFEQVHLRRYLQAHEIDLVHSLGYVSPLFPPCWSVVTVHDLNFKAFGAQMEFSRRLFLGFFVKQSILRSKKIITVSEFTRQEILLEYNIAPEKVVVTLEGFDRGFLDAAPDSGGDDVPDELKAQTPYIVAFSSTYPNKNIPRLIEAFLDARRKNGISHKLLLIGHPHHAIDENLGNRTEEEKNCIIRTGYLDRRQVKRTLQGADFLVFPSFYEGFGLPILEAMASGVPVVCSNTAALPEISGGAAVFFDPYSVEDIAGKITAVARDAQLRARLKKEGYKNIERFSWEKTAALTVAVYEELKHMNPPGR